MLAAFWEKVIKPILVMANVRTIVEIGADRGENTLNLLSYCKLLQGNLIVIDPSPDCPVSNWISKYDPYLTFLPLLSLQALPTLGQYDAIFIDGDHNWYTVYNELKNIENNANKFGKWPIVFLHDTEWPYGRRDMYYLPETIPKEFLKPYQQSGIVKRNSGLTEHGINSEFYNASVEGGKRNGVLTAIEDFLSETTLSCRFYRLKSNFGLGIILPDDYLLNSKVKQVLHHSRL